MAQIYNYPNMIPAGTVLNANLLGRPMQLQNALFYCIQVAFTGTASGTFKLQGSCDNSATVTAVGQSPYLPAHWSDIVDQTQAVTSAGSYLFNVSFASYSFVRLVYTDSSGGTSTAVLTVSTLNVKG